MSTESPEKENQSSILEEPDFKEFVSTRKIDQNDFELIVKLSGFPKDLFLEFHNFFNLNKDGSVSQLESMVSREENDLRRDFLETFLEFTKKYDWQTSWHLNRLFERV